MKTLTMMFRTAATEAQDASSTLDEYLLEEAGAVFAQEVCLIGVPTGVAWGTGRTRSLRATLLRAGVGLRAEYAMS